MGGSVKFDTAENIREWERIGKDVDTGMPEELIGRMEQAYTNVVRMLLREK